MSSPSSSPPSPSLQPHRLKALRLKRQMRAREVARRAGISAAQLYRLELGTRPNTAAITLARVALVLDTSVEYLLGLTDDERSVRELLAAAEQAEQEPRREGDKA